MASINEIVHRQLSPMLDMLEKAIHETPDVLLNDEGSDPGIKEHLYHVLVSMDIWLHPDVRQYPFGEIAEDDAAQMKAKASRAISRQYLLDYLTKLRRKADHLLDPSQDLLVEQDLGHPFSILDRCLGQLRHTQHHIGSINVLLHLHGVPAIGWQGWGE